MPIRLRLLPERITAPQTEFVHAPSPPLPRTHHRADKPDRRLILPSVHRNTNFSSTCPVARGAGKHSEGMFERMHGEVCGRQASGRACALSLPLTVSGPRSPRSHRGAEELTGTTGTQSLPSCLPLLLQEALLDYPQHPVILVALGHSGFVFKGCK